MGSSWAATKPDRHARPAAPQLEEFKKRKQAALAKKAGPSHASSAATSPEKDGAAAVPAAPAAPAVPPGLALPPTTGSNSPPHAPFFAGGSAPGSPQQAEFASGASAGGAGEPGAAYEYGGGEQQAALWYGGGEHQADYATAAAAAAAEELAEWQAPPALPYGDALPPAEPAAFEAPGAGGGDAEALRAQVGELLQSVDQLHRALQVRRPGSKREQLRDLAPAWGSNRPTFGWVQSNRRACSCIALRYPRTVNRPPGASLQDERYNSSALEEQLQQQQAQLRQLHDDNERLRAASEAGGAEAAAQGDQLAAELQQARAQVRGTIQLLCAVWRGHGDALLAACQPGGPTRLFLRVPFLRWHLRPMPERAQRGRCLALSCPLAAAAPAQPLCLRLHV